MDEGYGTLPSSHLLGSVPAVIPVDKKHATAESSQANQHAFAPGGGGYQPPGSPYVHADGTDQGASSWKGFLSIASYTPYFNADTDIVVDRLISSVNSFRGDFFGKIEANPDLYGPVWISTTLVFTLAALGNCATYLMQKKTETNVTWNFDVNYINWAACVLYTYLVVIPAAFYFLLQYFGVSNVNLVRLWCMWGYSLFIFIPGSLFLVIPVEMIRWIIILLVGSSSGTFIAMNMKTYTEGDDLMLVVVGAFLLQFALAVFIKVFFFA